MKINNLLYFVALLVCPVNVNAGVGQMDNREYVQWNQEPYNKIVHFMGKCTAQYIAPDILLTNAHCVYQSCYDSELDMPECTFVNSSGQRGTARVFAAGRPFSIMSGGNFVDATYTPVTDWVLLRTELISQNTFDVQPGISPGTFDSAGFGAMRVINDEELPIIRKKFAMFIRSKLNNKKTSDKKILDNNQLGLDMWADFDAALASDNDGTGVSIKPLFPADEPEKLKVHKDCRVISVESGYFAHTCDTFHGNSGGAIFRGNKLYGIVASGQDKFNTHEGDGYGVDAASFYDAVTDAQTE